jgi:hypothetical protein
MVLEHFTCAVSTETQFGQQFMQIGSAGVSVQILKIVAKAKIHCQPIAPSLRGGRYVEE